MLAKVSKERMEQVASQTVVEFGVKVTAAIK
jgi:hypothetical protein